MSEPSPPDPEDALAGALGQLVREREAAEIEARAPEWEAVLAGALELDDAVEQRRAAGDMDADELERAAAYFRPFDASETEDLVGGLLAGLDPGEAQAEADEEAEAGNVIPFAPRAEAKAEERERKPDAAEAAEVHDPSKSSFWWIPGGMLAAAAAAIALWWVWPRDGELGGDMGGGEVIAQRDPLPSFALQTDGGLRELRGDEDGAASPAAVHRYRRDTPFSWVLRPAVSTEASVGVRAFALVEGSDAGLPLAIEPLVQVSDSGSVRIAGEIGQLGLEPGRYSIVLVVGRTEALPSDASALAEPSEPAPWQVQRVEIELSE